MVALGHGSKNPFYQGRYYAVYEVSGLDFKQVQCHVYLRRRRLMEWKLFATVFVTIFIAELADKTQLATLLFASDQAVSKWIVFFGSASALVVASALGVLAGGWLSDFINIKIMSVIAGSGFMLIGAWTLYHGLQQGAVS